jgi:molecular chaperone DnaJ
MSFTLEAIIQHHPYIKWFVGGLWTVRIHKSEIDHEKVICSLCHGRGGDVIITCSNCNGSGYDPQDDNPFAQCHTCYGEGEENADVCPRCGGDGYYYVDEDEDEEEDEDEDEDEEGL